MIIYTEFQLPIKQERRNSTNKTIIYLLFYFVNHLDKIKVLYKSEERKSWAKANFSFARWFYWCGGFCDISLYYRAYCLNTEHFINLYTFSYKLILQMLLQPLLLYNLTLLLHFFLYFSFLSFPFKRFAFFEKLTLRYVE